MNYTYKILTKDPATDIAQVQYTPDETSLPMLVRPVNLFGVITEQQEAVAVAGSAPYPEWMAIDPSISPPPVPLPFVVDSSRQPPA